MNRNAPIQEQNPDKHLRNDSPWSRIVNTRNEGLNNKGSSTGFKTQKTNKLPRGQSLGNGIVLMKRKSSTVKSRSPNLKGVFLFKKRSKKLKASLRTERDRPNRPKLYFTQGHASTNPTGKIRRKGKQRKQLITQSSLKARGNADLKGALTLLNEVNSGHRKLKQRHIRQTHQEYLRKHTSHQPLIVNTNLRNPKQKRNRRRSQQQAKPSRKLKKRAKLNTPKYKMKDFLERQESKTLGIEEDDGDLKYEIEKFKEQFETEKERLNRKLEDMKRSRFSDEEGVLLNGLVGVKREKPKPKKKRSYLSRKATGTKRSKARESENGTIGVIGMKDWEFGPHSGVVGLLSNSNSELNLHIETKGKKIRIQKKRSVRRDSQSKNGKYSIQVRLLL